VRDRAARRIRIDPIALICGGDQVSAVKDPVRDM